LWPEYLSYIINSWFLGPITNLPEYVLLRRAIERHNEAVPQLLIKWFNLSEDDASWENYYNIKARFPDAVLEDKNTFEGRECQKSLFWIEVRER
jgi:Chromo (CHRromatin Organisation MOdifier) domain